MSKCLESKADYHVVTVEKSAKVTMLTRVSKISPSNSTSGNDKKRASTSNDSVSYCKKPHAITSPRRPLGTLPIQSFQPNVQSSSKSEETSTRSESDGLSKKKNSKSSETMAVSASEVFADDDVSLDDDELTFADDDVSLDDDELTFADDDVSLDNDELTFADDDVSLDNDELTFSVDDDVSVDDADSLWVEDENSLSDDLIFNDEENDKIFLDG